MYCDLNITNILLNIYEISAIMEGPNGITCSTLENPTSVVPLPVGDSPTSANSSDNYMYDDSSMSDSSLYASDQENLSTPRRRYGSVEKIRYVFPCPNFSLLLLCYFVVFCIFVLFLAANIRPCIS